MNNPWSVYGCPPVLVPGTDPQGRNWVQYVYNEQNEMIARVMGATPEEAQRNAQAIAAVPVLAEAGQEIRSRLFMGYGVESWLQKVFGLALDSFHINTFVQGLKK